MTADTPWKERPPHLQRNYPDTPQEKVYLRQPGRGKVRLRQPWGSQAMAEEAAAAMLPERARAPLPATTDSLVGAITEYRGSKTGVLPVKEASADFLVLEPRTQKLYEHICDEFEKTFAGILLEDVNAAYVLALRNKWAKRGHRAANNRLQVMMNICKAPRIRGQIAGNPFELIDKVARPHDLGVANPAWEDWEVEAHIALALATGKPGLARAIALGRWGGFRKQSICAAPLRSRIKRPNQEGTEERRLFWLTEKKKVLCDRREDPRLTALLDETPNKALTIAYNKHGQPWTGRALSHAVDRQGAKLVASGTIRGGLTIHGLRHARGVEVAYSNGTDAEIMAQLDHATPRQASLYRAQAERRRLADAAQDKITAGVAKIADERAARAAMGQTRSS